MKKLFLLVLASFCLAASASSQASGPRTFDNFDRSQGVQVYLPPVATTATATSKKGKPGRGTRVPTADDKRVKKTASTGWTVSVTDGLAQRETIKTFGGPRLAMGSSSNLKGFTTGNPVHDSYIVDSSRRYNIDPLLIYSQMHQESSFKIGATSNKGASGLMQLMPGTARRFGVTSIYDPKQNIDAGVRYMRWLLDTFNGDVVLALAGYNAGEGAVMKYGWNVPPYRETQEYVRRITSRYGAITDGRYIHTARPIGSQSAKLIQRESRPLAVYEPGVLAVRTADGKMMLMNQ
ncbi:MAG: lytic transglycosylase domain-containing protein [Acidobacteriota bacterium]